MKPTGYQISAVINLHGEGLLCYPSLQSFFRLCSYANETGISVEKMVVLDRPTDDTRRVLDEFIGNFDAVLEVAVGDLGESRNCAVEKAKGEFVATFDGDDLWGRKWLVQCLETASATRTKAYVLHPELVYYFDATDFGRTSLNDRPSEGHKSFFLRHNSSKAPNYFPESIRFNNVFTSNIFAPISVLKRFPYTRIDSKRGLGVEDWAWNALTLSKGIPHLIVKNGVHMVRVKHGSESLGIRNSSSGLLPPLANIFQSLGA